MAEQAERIIRLEHDLNTEREAHRDTHALTVQLKTLTAECEKNRSIIANFSSDQKSAVDRSERIVAEHAIQRSYLERLLAVKHAKDHQCIALIKERNRLAQFIAERRADGGDEWNDENTDKRQSNATLTTPIKRRHSHAQPPPPTSATRKRSVDHKHALPSDSSQQTSVSSKQSSDKIQSLFDRINTALAESESPSSTLTTDEKSQRSIDIDAEQSRYDKLLISKLKRALALSEAKCIEYTTIVSTLQKECHNLQVRFRGATDMWQHLHKRLEENGLTDDNTNIDWVR